jgi:hypothetical protein
VCGRVLSTAVYWAGSCCAGVAGVQCGWLRVRARVPVNPVATPAAAHHACGFMWVYVNDHHFNYWQQYGIKAGSSYCHVLPLRSMTV